MMNTRLLSSFSLLFVLLVGCSSSAQTTSEPMASDADAQPDTTAQSEQTVAPTSELKTAVEYASALEQALDAYEAQRQKTQAVLDSTTQGALRTLNSDPTTEEVRRTTSTWRREWNDVQSQTRQLWQDLASVEAAATRYFTHLEHQTSMISNSDLRTSEREQNASLKQTWQNTTTAATSDIEVLQSHLQQGNDLYIAMLNASLRAGFAKNVEQLQTLSESSLDLLGSLHDLTRTGRSLTGREAVQAREGQARESGATNSEASSMPGGSQ